jgi:RimJ/RimL family protein N-acetyltransferase
MGNPYWPLFDLRIRCGRVELRLPTDEDLVNLATLAARGVHDPSTMPFLFPWTDQPSPELERGLLQWGWRHRANWSVDDWTFNTAVVVDGHVAGVQSLMGKDFAQHRLVKSGSWLGLDHQGQGLGKEMRTAILYFAFESLGARIAQSGGFIDNERSLRLSRSLGYVETARRREVRRGVPTEVLEMELDRATWDLLEHPVVEVSGLKPCLEFFVAPDGASASD